MDKVKIDEPNKGVDIPLVPHVQPIVPFKTETETVMETVERVMTGLTEMRKMEIASDEKVKLEQTKICHVEKMHENYTMRIVIIIVSVIGIIGSGTLGLLGKPDLIAPIITGTITGLLGLVAGKAISKGNE